MPERLVAERAVVNAAVWGVGIADAYLDDLERARFVDPWCRAVVATIVELRRDHRPADPTALHARLVELGHHGPGDAWRLIMAGETAAGARLAGLPFYLEDLQREDLRATLISLADALERPGGVERVAAVIGRAA